MYVLFFSYVTELSSRKDGFMIRFIFLTLMSFFLMTSNSYAQDTPEMKEEWLNFISSDMQTQEVTDYTRNVFANFMYLGDQDVVISTFKESSLSIQEAGAQHLVDTYYDEGVFTPESAKRVVLLAKNNAPESVYRILSDLPARVENFEQNGYAPIFEWDNERNLYARDSGTTASYEKFAETASSEQLKKICQGASEINQMIASSALHQRFGDSHRCEGVVTIAALRP